MAAATGTAQSKIVGTEFSTSWEAGDPPGSRPDAVEDSAGVTLSATDPTPGMGTDTADGPSSGYTAKRHVGFSGVRSLAYAGRHRSAGRAYSINELFAVRLEVTATTQLSYKIIPADPSDGTELPAPGSFVAVDLAFSDGSYLHQLGATDQHGFGLTAADQGGARVLLANQWNSVRSDIGRVAAGKTITRILLSYDRTGDERSFAGWVDDLVITATPEPAVRARLSEWVDTRRGTNSNGAFSRGGTIPAVAVPHGFNFWTPVTNAGSRKWLYEYQQHNDALNRPTLQALSLSHIAYPWGVDHGTFQIMPSTDAGVPNPDHAERALPFRHEDEIAHAHYYSVTCANGLRAEVAPTDHAAIFRFTFPGDDANLIFDNLERYSGSLRLDAEGGRLSGHTGQGEGRMFLVATFDRPVVRGGSLQGERGGMGYFRFATTESRAVIMKIATSRISLDQAEHNLELELGADDTFDSVRERAQTEWDATLGVITDVQGATPEQLTTLYSCLYRMSLYQNSRFENAGTADRPVYQHVSAGPTDEGDSTATHTGAEVLPGILYRSTGFWDTYRTTWPALALLYPAKTARLLDGIVTSYRESGRLGIGMVGTSSDVALADAYLRGATDFDIEGAYESAIKNATVVSDDKRLGRPGLASSIFLGYTALSAMGARQGGTPDEGAAEALENFLNDFGIARLARALHERTGTQRYLDEHHYFLNRSLGYGYLFDPATGFFQGRTADGRRRLGPDEFDPKTWGYDYTETNGWGMAFAVPHDGQGLANLLGGRDALRAKLDEFFTTPERMQDYGSYGGIIHEQREAANVQLGQWGLSNQPAFHIPHMYNFTGRPDQAQAKIREGLARLFVGGDIGQGYAGDEDTGSMSAWFVLNALGLYPLRVGTPTFVIGSPLFRSATVNLTGGNKIVIEASDNSPQNVYVQGLRINGEPYDRTEVAQSVLTDGANLRFDLGPEPSGWATGPAAEPESITVGDQPPAPMRDLTRLDNGDATGPDGAPADALFDDTSDTELILAGDRPTVTWRFTDGAARTAHSYTLTSARSGGDPSAWELQASPDGAAWVTIDRRDGESFPWRRQTRVFSITEPGAFAHYRLAVTAAVGDAPAALAELELLGPG
ncbi:GH92 family glycosyl hydrolase [Microlunatus speluncae]|uniref:GH92 family glycosyl hydrolase n=1 Tax=Microlunatus speluncae TaxID=2594267 RepID=UPI001C2D0EEF|nr:GH92 family glycosyl hydrolase [Microlunatus speluncae]